MKIIYHSEKLGARNFNPIVRIKELEREREHLYEWTQELNTTIHNLNDYIDNLHEKIERLNIDRSKHFVQSTR